jgi:endonuclease/exonuclease/phosphatase family metal-dependent hydrolase
MKDVDINALASSNLKGWARVKLKSLDGAQLNELASVMGVEERCVEVPGGDDVVVNALLQRKKENMGTSSTPKVVRNDGLDVCVDEKKKQASDGVEIPNSCCKGDSSCDRRGCRGGILVCRHQIKILSFNSLKLRIEREALREDWISFAALLSEFDVVLMSEVPSKCARERSEMLMEFMMMKSCSSCSSSRMSWSFHVSEPSGPGNPEVHVALVRFPLRVLRENTVSRVNGLVMDHSPFQLVVEDCRFDIGKRFVLTHVHMPPCKRARERDTQLRCFLRCYALQSGLRFDLPFDPKAAKEREIDGVVHVVCGDFNVHPSAEKYELQSSGWSNALIPERVSTTSGGMGYDNFIVDKHTAARSLAFADVLELSVLQNSSTCKIGLSDHHPVVLTVKELPLIGRRSTWKVRTFCLGGVALVCFKCTVTQ